MEEERLEEARKNGAIDHMEMQCANKKQAKFITPKFSAEGDIVLVEKKGTRTCYKYMCGKFCFCTSVRKCMGARNVRKCRESAYDKCTKTCVHHDDSTGKIM
jgi:hypothetical protein